MMKAMFISWRLLTKLLLIVSSLYLLIGAGRLFKDELGKPAMVPEGSPPNQVNEIIIRGPNVNKVALTINVDWGEEYIPQLLDILARQDAKATFFFTGRFAEKYPERVKQVFASGHEVGNHGYSHPHPTKISNDANRKEIRRTHQILTSLTGKETRWFAPPYGEHDDKLLNVAREQGYGTILWTVDSADWLKPTPEVWMKRVTKGIGPGAIVLMHPTTSTVQSLPQLLKYCKEKEWMPVTLSDLMVKP